VRNLCIIPARGGSRRIPRKNIKPFNGVPIIAMAIRLALDSKFFDEVIVSTEDVAIRELSLYYGASTPFWRPKHLATDETTTIEVIQHAIQWHEERGDKIEIACCLYPCSPFVTEELLGRAFSMMTDTSVHYTVPVTEYSTPIERALRINEAGNLDPLLGPNLLQPTQKFEKTYHDAGQFYLGRGTAWINAYPILSNNTKPIVLRRRFVCDIDTIEDWEFAEAMYKLLQKSSHHYYP
jgi:pseudaminic acid cytidylyltransferase